MSNQSQIGMSLFSVEFGIFNSERPTLLFIHGLLGDHQDWKAVIDLLSDRYHCIAIDLPGHGVSRDIEVDSFEQTVDLINCTIDSYSLTNVVVIGYSLGARIAMFGAAFHLFSFPISQLIIEGGNFGLATKAERDLRWSNDNGWALRFKNEAINKVLIDWYHQPVFNSLDLQQKQQQVAKRTHNSGEKIAKMLCSTSLARQPELLLPLKQLRYLVDYIVGNRDTKFLALAEQSHLSVRVIEEAGHNTHSEQPSLFSSVILQLIHR
ncbi:2-succinyl-6-hydroxy-2,4-cyclohexadiene-1-carboxylate synthase [Vibrio sp. SS-MA-C1-2]|uniref:2-succinyl-6-hydroxy-2, 4-cyclohexadiene-1-carboxylate synthase n=1 Tax=Vibrio sp. SS-MA-C1-2 TaxID=2908646 RepID=UPI001F40FBFE|nr:2-succinyl-6-hydroxy-2,4-cyclohexadiene-1-carboxylate synthase [Vibrio sp. SS-MA-C1-2]UJF19950.1 2-succinyl-6-hydroxy-2,4-cyclohexadiene-1-carboxylate synthase [Vibrio sp. SS-MA-C1-2]